jgi:general secretion pathway protein K
MFAFGEGDRSPDLPSERADERGVALIMVLWVLALLSVLAVGFASNARTELLIVRNQIEAARARAIAEAGISLAILEMTRADQALRWIADGREHVMAYGESRILIRVQDEAGKVDINVAPDELLDGLFRSVGVDGVSASRLVDAIADWKDPDDLRRLSGAEAADYRAAGLPYAPRNGPFLAVDELRLVLGMTPALFARIWPFVTVYSRSAQINPLTAPAEVIGSLPGVGPDQADIYVAARAALDVPQPSMLPGLIGAERYLAQRTSQTVTIRSESRTAHGGSFVREAVAVITRRPTAPYRLVAWRQGSIEQSAGPTR